MAKGRFKRLIGYSFIAGGIGYLIGLLSAPRSGRETRQQITDDLALKSDDLKIHLSEIKVELQKAIEKAEESSTQAGDSLKNDYDLALSAAHKSLKEIKKALGDAASKTQTDKYLKHLLDGSKQTLEKLISFIKK